MVRIILSHPVSFSLLTIAGLFFGRFRGYWEDGRMPEAYPAAVRLSRKLGFYGAGIFLLTSLFQAHGEFGLFPVVMGIFFAPVMWSIVCGLSRPVIYLAAWLYYSSKP